MNIVNNHGTFSLCEAPTRFPNEVAILVNDCRHVVQDGPFIERDSETGELTPRALDILGNIVLEDHLEFCLGFAVEPELKLDSEFELFGGF